MTADNVFIDNRKRLFGIAYRMLGQVGDAEDAVQETFIRWTQTDQSEIDNPAAWLTTVLTRICLDRLKSAQRQRESYVGPWLPEPLVTDDVDPADIAGTSDSITLAFLVVLERLSPAERAVFLLHDVFGYTHTEIASMLERSPSAVRQLASRARSHLDDHQPRYESDGAQRQAVADEFMAATVGGELERLMDVLAPDVTFTSDGGGVVQAVRHPQQGAERVAAILRSFLDLRTPDHRVRQVQVNGMPGIMLIHRDEVDSLWTLHVVDDQVSAIHVVRNPEKLRRLSATGTPSIDM
jgi:RNA polymerase sigma-70 factor (ECF subfamily)